MCRAFRPFRLQPPPRPFHRFNTLPLSAEGIRFAPVWVSPIASRLTVRVGRIEFTCVADWTFTSGCSPPRLTATQFPLVTGRRTSTWRGLAPLGPDTLTDALARTTRCPGGAAARGRGGIERNPLGPAPRQALRQDQPNPLVAARPGQTSCPGHPGKRRPHRRIKEVISSAFPGPGARSRIFQGPSATSPRNSTPLLTPPGTQPKIPSA